MFTRTHYRKIAKALATVQPDNVTPTSTFDDRQREMFTAVIDALVELFESDNPTFNAEKFREACYAST